MLFSDLGLSLAHHYRVYRGGLSHATFRGDMTRLRALLPTPTSTNGEPVSPPEAVRGATPKSTRRSHRPFRPVQVMSAAVGDLPVLTIQDPSDVVGASVVDCRPPVLPVSIPLSALSPRTVENARGTSGFNPSRTEGPIHYGYGRRGRRATDAGFFTGSVHHTCGHDRRVGRTTRNS